MLGFIFASTTILLAPANDTTNAPELDISWSAPASCPTQSEFAALVARERDEGL